MTSSMHSKINTYLLSIIGALMLIGVTIAGFICNKVWDINEKVAVQSQNVSMHTAQIDKVEKDVAQGKVDIQAQVSKVDTKVDALRSSQTDILIALEALKKPQSRQ